MECVPDLAFLQMAAASAGSEMLSKMMWHTPTSAAAAAAFSSSVAAATGGGGSIPSNNNGGSQSPAQSNAKQRKTNFTSREVEALLAAVADRKDTVLFGVAGGLGWARAWHEVAQQVSAVEGIHRSESDVRKKWTYLKWEAKNTSKPGRDLTSRGVLDILTSREGDSPGTNSLLEQLLVSSESETLAAWYPQLKHDLTKVTWEHAVNSREKLFAALKGESLMLEADIVLGHTSEASKLNNDPPLAVMAHPPQTISELTLKEFLQIVAEADTGKGVKLDFKSREAFGDSENILDDLFNNFTRTYPVWLNADIIPGPVNGTKEVVDADYFLTTCISRYPSATLSVGWSTSLAPGSTQGQYRQEDLNRMADALNRNNVLMNPVTFAVRAALAARSVDLLANLIKSSSSPTTTLTVWSSVNTDLVDINGVKELIQKVGNSRVYLDLPQEMTDQVLKQEPSSAASSISLSILGLLAALCLANHLWQSNTLVV